MQVELSFATLRTRTGLPIDTCIRTIGDMESPFLMSVIISIARGEIIAIESVVAEGIV